MTDPAPETDVPEADTSEANAPPAGAHEPRRRDEADAMDADEAWEEAAREREENSGYQ